MFTALKPDQQQQQKSPAALSFVDCQNFKKFGIETSFKKNDFRY